MQNLSYWLAAAHAMPITPHHFWQWLSVFKDIRLLYQASSEEWSAAGIPIKMQALLKEPDWCAVDKTMQWLEQPNHHLLTIEDPAYPELLKQVSDPPLVLFVVGNKQVLAERQLGVVGARTVTQEGADHAYRFARHLSLAGYVITSGLALGVDAASHIGALEGRGLTTAVMGAGLSRIYPPRHRRLAATIVEKGGALVSEFPLQAPPLPAHFPRRNRIISGLSVGVFVVEAALRSGSLVTARHAVEQGREVFALPGSILNPMTAGCHALIRQGAKLVVCPEDILEEFSSVFPPIPVEISPSLAIIPENLSSEEQKIYTLIGDQVTSLDEIIMRSGLTAASVSSMLLLLEFNGHVRAIPGGYVREAAACLKY